MTMMVVMMMGRRLVLVQRALVGGSALVDVEWGLMKLASCSCK